MATKILRLNVTVDSPAPDLIDHIWGHEAVVDIDLIDECELADEEEEEEEEVNGRPINLS